MKSFVGPSSERAATVAGVSIPREELGPLERPTPRVESVACSTRYAVNSSLVPPKLVKQSMVWSWEKAGMSGVDFPCPQYHSGPGNPALVCQVAANLAVEVCAKTPTCSSASLNRDKSIATLKARHRYHTLGSYQMLTHSNKDHP